MIRKIFLYIRLMLAFLPLMLTIYFISLDEFTNALLCFVIFQLDQISTLLSKGLFKESEK